MQRFLIILLITTLSSGVLAQSAETSSMLTYRPVFYQKFLKPDSIDARSILYYNRYAYQKAKYGLLFGAMGAGLGASLIWLKTRDQTTCDLGCAIAYSVAIFGGGMLGFSLGTVYAAIKYRHEAGKRIHTNRYRVAFKKLGISLGTTDQGLYGGILYRKPTLKLYQPSSFMVFYSRYQSSWDYESKSAGETTTPTVFIQGQVAGAEVRLLWVDYQRVLGWLVGLEVGWYQGQLQENRDGQTRPKNVATFNAQLCFGSNLNLLKGLGIMAIYHYRLYGLSEALQPDGFSPLNKRNGFSLGVIWYIY